MSAKKTTAKKAAKKAATKSAAPAATKTAAKTAPSKPAEKRAAPIKEKPAPQAPSAEKPAQRPRSETSPAKPADRVAAFADEKGKAVSDRNGYELNFDIYRGRHVFVGDDHVGWIAPNGLLVLRPEFANIGFEEYVRKVAMQKHGRPLRAIEYSALRPVFGVEDTAGARCPAHILAKADPALGDLDGNVIAWHRENLSREEFTRRYGDRLDIDALPASTLPQREDLRPPIEPPRGTGSPQSPTPITPEALVGAQQRSMDPEKFDKLGDKAPDTELSQDRPVGLGELDDGRNEPGAYDLDEEPGDIDRQGDADPDNDEFLDEDPPDTP